MNPKALYIHIPFCDHICVYCDFYKMLAVEEEKEKYFKYLISELDMKKSYLSNLETIYIGGGTPSVYSPQELSTLLSYFKGVKFSEDGERTCEMSPSTATIEHLDAVFEAGINRVSFGVQSFDEEILKKLRKEKTDVW